MHSTQEPYHPIKGVELRQTSDKNETSRLMLIGIDSADADLIERWSDEGYLPVLQSLRQQGMWRRLRTTAEVMHVSAWPSVYTGTTPGKHGMYHAYQIKPGEQDIHRTRANECAQFPFWKFLDDCGKRCIVVDAFMNYPLEGFRGVQVLEYGTWTWFWNPMASPNAIWKEIVGKFGPYPAPEHSKVLTVPEPNQFRTQLASGAAVKSKVVRWLMREKPWDMFFVTFGETHPAGHYLWHLADRCYPAHSGNETVGVEHALRDVYVAVDRAIGEIIEELDDSVTVMITSGDGMGPNYAGAHLVPEVLNKLGFYCAAGIGPDPTSESGTKSARQKKGIASIARELIPFGVRRAISRCLPRYLQHQLSMKWANANIDWKNTRAFCIPNANEGYVRLNLKGREPMGTVENGTAYTELIAELQMRLKELVNPKNGRLAAQQVLHMDDVFPGERRDHLPDIVVNWNIDSKVLSELESEGCGSIIGKAAGYQTDPFYTGNHRPAAFALSRGPQITQGKLIVGGHIVDIAPTILAIFGIDPPSHMDGCVWNEFTGQHGNPAG